MEHVFFAMSDDGVARVIAALRAHDHIRVFGEVIDNFSFAFIAPLQSSNNGVH